MGSPPLAAKIWIDSFLVFPSVIFNNKMVKNNMFDKKQNEILYSVAKNDNKSIWVHSRLTNTTYAHTHKIVSDFVKRGILKTIRGSDSRTKLVSYTNMGSILKPSIIEYIEKTMRYIKNENKRISK